ncbi:MAG: hypothetical protein IJ630_02815 [Treponema sp.]|nr:hypothetical protein [Treponema sp.]
MKKIVYFIFASIFSVFLFSCHGIIFDEIRNEVELDDAKVSGQIKSIVRYSYDCDSDDEKEECVFTATGKIYYRNISSTENSSGEEVSKFADSIASKKIGFSSFSKPSSGRVLSLAADKTYLYALVADVETDDDDDTNGTTTRQIWSFNGSEWTQIVTTAYSSSYDFVLFCTNSPKNENRKAYFRYGSKVYELSGSTKIDVEDESQGGYVYVNGDSSYIGTYTQTEDSSSTALEVKSCAILNGTVYFSSEPSLVSDETETEDDDASYLYFGNSDDVYYSEDGSDWSSVDLDCSTICSLGVTDTYLLIGTSDGIAHILLSTLKGGASSASTTSFDNNAASALSSYYKVPAILVVNPALDETSGTIFASSITSSTSASLNNVGLWSYFSSEGKWNRE